jgi:hypothetical protein
MNHYVAKSPVLFLVFNRPDIALTVFNEIRIAKPSKLYVAADGPAQTVKTKQNFAHRPVLFSKI